MRTLQRRVDFLKSREHKNSFDLAELGALEWAIVNLQPQPAPVQEPVYLVWLKAHCAWAHTDKAGFDRTSFEDRWLLYATPPAAKRQWVELTDGEIDDLSREMVKGKKSVNWLSYSIEAKLKERNG
jgi:hypothetical protein